MDMPANQVPERTKRGTRVCLEGKDGQPQAWSSLFKPGQGLVVRAKLGWQRLGKWPVRGEGETRMTAGVFCGRQSCNSRADTMQAAER